MLLLVLLLTGCQLNTTNQSTHSKADKYFEELRTQKVESEQSIKWRNIGPGMSGYNEKLWTHPSDANVMLIAPDMHVAYGSWDKGKSWQSIQDVDELGQEMKRVIDVGFSYQDANYAVALDWNGWVYESSNQGRTWVKLAELSPGYQSVGVDPYDPLAFKKGWYDEQIGKRLSTIAVDPSDDKVLYVGAGDFFNVKENHRSKQKPHGNQLSYADYGYIFKTTDKGRNWQKITADFPADLDVGKIIIHPLSPNQIIMMTNHGLMKSEDAGISWRQSGSGLPNNLPRDISAHFDEKTKEFVLYLVDQTTYHGDKNSVTSKGGIYKSVDGGEQWVNITGNLFIDLTQLNYPAEIERYYRTISHWFGMSRPEAKQTFNQLPSRILPVFNRVAVNPLNKDEIYLTYNKKHDRTFGPGEVWRSLDGGQTWKVVARHGNYWLSKKDQTYWASRNNPIGSNVEFSHVQAYMDGHAEVEGNRLLAINSLGEVFISVGQQTQRSIDRGEAWQQIDDVEVEKGSGVWVGRGNSDLPGRFMLHQTGIEGRRLLASGEHGVWETVPTTSLNDNKDVALRQIEGQNNIDGMVSVSTIAVHPKNPQIIYLLAWRQEHRGKLRRSLDGGKTWQNISTIFELPEKDTATDKTPSKKVIQGPPRMMPAQNALLIDPVNPNNMYFAATKNAFSEIYRAPRRQPSKGEFGVMKSIDGGVTWMPSNQGFHAGFTVRRLILDPHNNEVLYAAASDKNGGLYTSHNQGETWQKVALPTQIRNVNNIFIDPSTRHQFISTGGFYNGAYEQGGAWRSIDSGTTWEKIFHAPVVLQVETSLVDPDLLLVVVGNQMRMDRQFLNPGIYLSQDKGENWKKINRGLRNNDKIVDAKPDPYNPNVLWASSWGSGWFVAYLNDKDDSGWFRNTVQKQK